MRGSGNHGALADGAVRAPAELELPGPDRGFNLIRRDGLILIVPGKAAKFSSSDWPAEERPFRSLIVRESDHSIVSSGFPKFFNMGEDHHDSGLLNAALEGDDSVFFSEKADGSLAVRSVIDGKIIFRTRGTFDGGEHGPAMRRVAERRYPILLDPEFEPDRSLLFEFVSPNFRIVLPYAEDDLIFLGAISHETMRLSDLPEMRELADRHGFNLVAIHELPRDPEELVRVVGEWQGKEGVVARCNNGQTLVKLKGADYLARHRIRFALTARVVRQVCLERQVEKLEDFESYLAEQGGDWELAVEAKPLVELFVQTRAQARSRFDIFAGEVAIQLKNYPVRKEFALEYATKLDGKARPAAFAIADGRPDNAYAMIEEELLDVAFAEFDARDLALLESEE